MGSKDKSPIDGKALGSLLSRANLGGLVEECVLDVRDGVGSIQAIDMTNSVFLSCQEQLGEGLPNSKIGIGNLSVLCKFFAMDGEFSINLSDEWITVRRKGHGFIRLQLLKSDQVPTAVTQEDAEKKIIASCEVSLPFEEDSARDFEGFMGLMSCASVELRSKEGKISLSANKSEPQQFNVQLGEAKEIKDGFKVAVYGDQLLRVVKVLHWEKDHTPTIRVGEKSPLVIQQDKRNFWALTPITD